MDFTILATIIINGICTGGVYGLTASAFSFQLGALRVVNFSYGAFLMVAMYAVFFLVQHAKVPLWVAGLVFMPVFALLGWVLRRFHVTTVRDEIQILMTMGLAIIFENAALFVWGSFPRSLSVIEQGFEIGGIYIGITRLGLLVLSAVILLGFHLFLTRTWVGMAIRAMVQTRDAAIVAGVDTEKIACLAFAVSSGIVAMAAALLMALFSVEPGSGGYYLLFGFLVTVMGGPGNLWGSFLAGCLIGIISAVAMFLNPGMHDTVIFVSFVLVLLIRPYGLFGSKEK